jgi:hypothetical protein
MTGLPAIPASRHVTASRLACQYLHLAALSSNYFLKVSAEDTSESLFDAADLILQPFFNSAYATGAYRPTAQALHWDRGRPRPPRAPQGAINLQSAQLQNVGSRCALIAGEGACGPSEELERLDEPLDYGERSRRAFAAKL